MEETRASTIPEPVLDAAVSAADVYNPARDPNCQMNYEEIDRQKIQFAVKAAADFHTRADPDLDWAIIDAMVQYKKPPGDR